MKSCNDKYFARFVPLLALLLLIFSFIPSKSVIADDTLDVRIHSVKSVPVEGEALYDVNVFLSVLNGAGDPLKDLTLENFKIIEDSQPVELQGISRVNNENVNYILVIDNSGSMTGNAMRDARTAASDFITRMGKTNKVSVVTFNDDINTVVDFSTNHEKTKEEILKIEAKSDSGTILYDATYKAIEMVSLQPESRAAVILLTDGKDVNSIGKPYSFHTAEDVINLAKSAGVPVYGIGVGEAVDQNVMKRISTMSGGYALYTSNSSKIDDLFSRIQELLNSEYQLTYQSKKGAGSHFLTLEVAVNADKGIVAYEFSLPVLPTTITFTSIGNNDSISGLTKISAKILTQGAPIARVGFSVDGTSIGEDFSEPYEVDWKTGINESREAKIEAVAIGKDGAELARASVTVNIVPPTPEPGEESTLVNSNLVAGENTEDEGAKSSLSTNSIIGIVAGIVIIGGLIAFLIIRKRKKGIVDDEDFAIRSNEPMGDKTIDEISFIPQTYGTLQVEQSDNSMMVGQILTISKLPAEIGRDATHSDILFSSQDKAVSRRHAVLEALGQEIIVKDNGSTYGTFVDDNPVSPEGTIIRSGNRIRLGARTVLLFKSERPDIIDPDKTMDEIKIEYDPDRTRDPGMDTK